MKIRRGFTLVELLVVIAVVALLVGVLLPALSAARSSGTSLKCLSNLKQMGIAHADWGAANDDEIIFPMIPTWGIDNDTDLTKFWWQTMGEFMLDLGERDDRFESFRCPAWKPQYSNDQLSAIHSNDDDAVASGLPETMSFRTGYGMNRRLMTPHTYARYHYPLDRAKAAARAGIQSRPDLFIKQAISTSNPGAVDEPDVENYRSPPWRYVQIGLPSERIINGDSGNAWLDPSRNAPFWSNAIDSQGDPAGSGDPKRHSGWEYVLSGTGIESSELLEGKANYLYCDGHAESVDSLDAVQGIIDPLKSDYEIGEILADWIP
ncbi:MAG: prepilin-type N-terminal cleavage/methylation domain-containing protein [Planctomycetota bacterium]